MNITTNTTLDLPANGIFNCTTITIASNATLRFNRNTLNTPVYLLATNNVTINGTIDVSGSPGTATAGGAGGPGGFDGGAPVKGVLPASDGHGPGGGRGGTATDSWYDANFPGFGSYGSAAYYPYGRGNGAAYGSSLLIPLVGGSGGGGTTGCGGSGGGGAIMVASSTSIAIGGVITAAAGSYGAGNSGYGSGGAIRLVAPVISGYGSLSVNGTVLNSWYGYISGAGRVRIDCMDRRFLNVSYPVAVASIGANMVAFPPNSPRLDITRVATNTIPVGTSSPVFFMLPQGSDTNQTVMVQARNFGTNVAIRVVLTPDSGSSSSYDTNIDNSTINPASVTVPVVVPVNVQVQVNAWTR